MSRFFKTYTGVVLLLLLVSLAACAPEPEAPSSPASNSSWEPRAAQVGGASTEEYVGNGACQPCHAAQFDSHKHSRHMKTIYEATRASLGSLAPPEGPIPGGGRLKWDQDQLHIVVPDKITGAPVSVPIELALGSGKTGLTFLVLHEQGGLELHQSYFPFKRLWRVTPGQETFGKTVVGKEHSLQEMKRCIGCHAVSPPDGPMLPERKFFGVGCESCHGAGGAHVKAMEGGKSTAAIKMKSLKGSSGEELNTLCGRCHRSIEAMAGAEVSAKKSTNRFMPYGLSLSQCFQKSENKLTCVTCHSPHEDASTDPKYYEKTCLSCHSAPRKTCPVNPKEKCVSCHMPTRPVFDPAKTDIPISMSDHFIRVFRD